MSFNLPADYEVPSSGGKYMKFEQGDNVFRILGDPVLGWEGWETTEDGDRPVRFKMDEKPEDVSKFKREQVKHFWAMPVWNYQAEAVQILEITQSSIQKAIKSYYADADWGDPTGYDFKINRKGEGLDTEYTIGVKPHKELDAKIKQAYEDTSVDLEALFEGEDPFAMNVDKNGEPDTDEITVDDIPDF